MTAPVMVELKRQNNQKRGYQSEALFVPVSVIREAIHAEEIRKG